MFAKIILSFVLVYFLLCPLTPMASAKKSNRTRTRIVGGNYTNISTVPYLLQMWRGMIFICGASLISNMFALTAAHCVRDGNPEEFMIVGGATTLAMPGIRRRVEKIMIHPDYDNETYDADVAVLKLLQPMVGPRIRTIKLNTKVFRTGMMLRVSGWGRKEENATTVSNHVKAVWVRLIDKPTCRAQYKDLKQLTWTMFCASKPGEKDSCTGDSGGPAVSAGHQYGIVSWGHGCADQEYPGVYTIVRSVLDFIEAAMRQ